MNKIDLNCDMGEGMENDALIMPFITSANIACGYHAGNPISMYKTIEVAIQHNVAIGAHVSYLDKFNFGRTEMNLTATEVYELVVQQIFLLKEIADAFDITLRHVKPHGALYNQSAKDTMLAATIAKAIKDVDHNLTVVGLSGSYSIIEAKAIGLNTASEVFADRTYQDDGSLTPRSQSNALIENPDDSLKQVQQMIEEGTVTTVSGKIISIEADTICIHSDSNHAVSFAKAIHDLLKTKGRLNE